MTTNSNCTHETISKNGELIKYKVGLMNVEKERWKTVDYRISQDFRSTCSCAMFETQGILCKHILYVMKKKQIMDLSDYYILPRQTIDARFKVRNHIQTDDTKNGDNVIVLWSIQTNCNKAIEEARDSPADLNKLNKILVNFVEDQVVRKKLRQPDIHGSEIAFIDTCRVENTSQLCIRDPEGPVKTKGRPKKVKLI